ncbi:hypothetical protein [Streptomyces cucumeris]|uniref:hypothetical protein n=1 Tax=Streptomyces cucumeris TaxID=2962890 RepID=UPI0020C918FB|nr:hypothetical protein [Streptomyces sp. NEAU-Y11]MCP9205514.1 hypothetical protein [Streptomyces sp. NEAU-Y11]
MRTRTLTLAATALLCLPLAACSSDDSEGQPKAGKTFDCTSQDTTQAEWTKHCGDKAADTAKGPDPTKPMALGKGIETIGSPDPFEGPGGGVLEITPTTVIYSKSATGETAENGAFAIITYKARSTKAVAAAESAPIENGGWEWVAPDGQAVDTQTGNATNVTPNGYTSGGTVKPGTYQWRTQAFDITTAQRGGTLTYTDGDDTTWRWTMPAKDTGPELTKLKTAID